MEEFVRSHKCKIFSLQKKIYVNKQNFRQTQVSLPSSLLMNFAQRDTTIRAIRVGGLKGWI